ncbi:hypothetical protein Mpsy_1643 [Methanolobus psychrophilus R15]|nr:hypothetical protein Mpsy_1643 [Methanolobus psychrophilus R15]
MYFLHYSNISEYISCSLPAIIKYISLANRTRYFNIKAHFTCRMEITDE